MCAAGPEVRDDQSNLSAVWNASEMFYDEFDERQEIRIRCGV